jgi:hypothetical protein
LHTASTDPFPPGKEEHLCENSVLRLQLNSKLDIKLKALGMSTSLCNWILNFLTGRPPVVRVRVGKNTSAMLALNMGLPVHL